MLSITRVEQRKALIQAFLNLRRKKNGYRGFESRCSRVSERYGADIQLHILFSPQVRDLQGKRLCVKTGALINI